MYQSKQSFKPNIVYGIRAALISRHPLSFKIFIVFFILNDINDRKPSNSGDLQQDNPDLHDADSPQRQYDECDEAHLNNFLMWNRQVHSLLDGYDLAGYIDGSTEATITNDAGVGPNHAFTLWKRQDKLIYSGLLGTITTSIQPILSTTNMSASILTSTFAKPTRGNIKQVKQQIDNWTKGSKSINEYFQGFTTRFDQLAILGKPLDHEDQIEKILGGLPEDYKTLVDQVESRDTAPSLAELHEKLINQEAKLQTVVTPNPSAPVTANYTNY